ncbi:MAG: DMT family transporter [Candidatus Eisenbacteria bacterium]|uniref:DMT family transporter n=1 Tax=Eiseniibacteriota bacterium TaxID=2212470 RepID=A0A948S0Y4_UNCEI|nr:DMT family transporter [Candidatus Eisenbacteria bacterium]MBU1948586.1 DMT family transporter [Candidatus Eisenbacteria bacterium]MBU2693287.1 DMT family transporter [Candidatus Eisenbacteria bacterium]
MKTQQRAYAYALVAVAFWSTVATAFKISLRLLTPAQLLLYSSAISTLCLISAVLIQRKAAQLSLSRAGALRSLATGFINPFFYYLILFKAYSLLPGQEAQPLNFTWAIAMAVLSIPLLKQKIRPMGFLAILISFAGVYIISTRGDIFSFRPTSSLGVSLALVSSILWALYWIYNLRDPRDEVIKLFWGFLFGTLFILIYVLAAGEWVHPSSSALAGAAYIGLFEMGITFIVWLKALKLSRTTAQVSNLIFLAPFVSLVLLHFIAGEDIFPSSVVGLVLIVAGILLQRRYG